MPERRVLEVLRGYRVRDWDAWRDELRSLYRSSYKKRFYQPEDMEQFIRNDRRIAKLSPTVEVSW